MKKYTLKAPWETKSNKWEIVKAADNETILTFDGRAKIDEAEYIMNAINRNAE